MAQIESLADGKKGNEQMSAIMFSIKNICGSVDDLLARLEGDYAPPSSRLSVAPETGSSVRSHPSLSGGSKRKFGEEGDHHQLRSESKSIMAASDAADSAPSGNGRPAMPGSMPCPRAPGLRAGASAAESLSNASRSLQAALAADERNRKLSESILRRLREAGSSF